MFILQNYLKQRYSAEKNIEFIRELYQGQDTDQITHILAEGYLHQNPVHIPTGIKYDELKQDFTNLLLNKKWKWTLIYYEKQAYLRGERNIIAVISYSDVYDLYPTQEELAIQDFDKVPAPKDIRMYLRARATRAFFDKYSPKKGECFISGTFSLKLNLIGSGILSFRVFYDSLQFIQEKGFTMGMGWAASVQAQGVYQKISMIELIQQDLSNLYIEQTGKFPYRGQKFIQEVYVGNVNKTLMKLSDLINKKQL